MECPRCHADNRAGRRFCGECGLALPSPCPVCGFPNEGADKFCGGCGAVLGPAEAPARAMPSPQEYTPKHLAERILTSSAALEGERKQVTVLFADLKGSMELLADRDPEEARAILDPVLEHMMHAVHRYEGTVNQVMGDGIMALFGAPLAHEDHAVRAVYAALRMQEQVRRYADTARRVHGVEVQIRVGLNSGDVVVRSIGSDLRMDYTAVGQTTHLAARMEQLATPGSIRLTAETLRLAEGYVEVKPLGPIPVKGLAEPIEVYEATGAGDVRTRLQASARRGLTRFVGRDVELEQLRRAQEQAGKGQGQVVALVGEAGVGKSRLVYELIHSHRVQSWLTLESASVSYGKATSYLPLMDLLKGYFKIADRDDVRETREKITGKVVALDRGLEPTLPALLTLLDVPADDAAWEALDSGQRRQRTLDAIRRLLFREAREQPLLLVFEDLHWVDGETQALLDSVVDGLGSARILLLVNYRPEYRHGWAGKTYYAHIRLDAYPAERAGDLLEALLGEDATLAPLKRLLVRRGNPFFLEETVRTLVETKVLAGERGRHRLTQPVQAIQVPSTVQNMLAARIDRLTPDDKRLLQVASVIGKNVSLGLLQAVADLPDDALRRGLDRLQCSELLYEANLFPDLEYTFTHALTHEVAYGGILLERRRMLHARVVEAIETLYRERLTEHVERLAHHAFRGEVWDKAVAYFRQAGAKAFGRSAFREAATCFEQALAAAARAPGARDWDEVAAALHFDLRNALIPLSEHRRIVEHLGQGAAAAEAAQDHRRLGWILAYSSISLCQLERLEEAIGVGERAVALAGAIADVGLDIMANFFVGVAECMHGAYGRATERLRRNVELMRGERTWERFGEPGLPAVFSRAILAWCLAELGQFAEATAHGVTAAELAGAVDQPFTLSHACLGLGIARLGHGDVPQAIATLERGVEVCRAAEIHLLLPLIAGPLGSAYVQGGRAGDAVALLGPLVEQDLSRPIVAARSLRAGYLSDAYRELGRLEDAFDMASRALAQSRVDRERGSEARALRALAAVLARREPPELESAERHYRDGLGLAEELGMRALVAECHAGLARVSCRAGKSEPARDHLAAATALWRELGMSARLDPAYTPPAP